MVSVSVTHDCILEIYEAGGLSAARLGHLYIFAESGGQDRSCGFTIQLEGLWATTENVH